MSLNINSTRKILVTACCLLFIGLLAGSVIAFGQIENATPATTSGTVTTSPSPSLTVTSVTSNNKTVNETGTSPPSPSSPWGLVIIFGTMVLIVLVPIYIFARYNKETLKMVLDANQKFEPEKGKPEEPEKPDDKREPVTTLIEALIPPEPLGMPNGSVRAIVAIIGIGIFAYAVFTFSENRTELVAALIALVSSVTGFYFGARATEPVRESPNFPKTPPGNSK